MRETEKERFREKENRRERERDSPASLFHKLSRTSRFDSGQSQESETPSKFIYKGRRGPIIGSSAIALSGTLTGNSWK